jgi:type VII secretion-associated serine protease mycosin
MVTRSTHRLVTVSVLALLVSATTPAAGASAVAQTDEIAEGQWWQVQWEMDEVWQITEGAGVTVAVIDSGVDASTPELAGAVLTGADFTGGSGAGDQDSYGSGHGIEMASLIAGHGGDRGFRGVAPAATILPVTVVTEDAPPEETFNQEIQGIRYATDNGAQVINISLGTVDLSAVGEAECPAAYLDALRYAADNDVIVVASSGNEAGGTSEVPGRCPGVLTVGATDRQLNPWEDSHRSDYVDVAAAGVELSAIGLNGDPFRVRGTSAATALVSGAVALVRAEFPDASADEILRRMIYTSGDIHTEGWDDATGYGVVQPIFALTEQLPADAPNPVYEGLYETAGESPPQPAGPTLAPDVGASDDSEGGGPGLVLLAVVGGLFLLVIVVIGVVLAVTLGRRRRPTTYPHQYPGPPVHRPGPPPSGWSPGPPQGPGPPHRPGPAR